ncbi:MAG: nuclear transport factor 2 family protein, partial [Parvularcula sp.]|nr:nuclear transport factor 2 family protein [Parvularcula sp.]
MVKPLLLAAAVSILTPLALAHAHSEPSAQHQHHDLALFAERYAEAWSSQNPHQVAAFFAADGRLTINGGEPAVGHEAIAAVARSFMEAFPDMVVAFDRLGTKGERTLFHWTLNGTNTGPGGNGASVKISGVEAWILGEGGLIADSAGSFDAEDYARQLRASASEKPRSEYSLFPASGTLTHAEDGVVLPDGRLLVGDWIHGLVTLDPDGTKRPFGDFASAGFRSKPDPMWNSPNGVSWEPDGRHVLVADITGGHIYRVDTQTEAVVLLYDHPFGVNAVIRDPSGAIWFTQSTENAAREGSEARMFAAANKPLGDGSLWRMAADEVGQVNPKPETVVGRLDFANGIVFDAPRGRLYVAEIMANRILSFALDLDNGTLADRRVLVTLPTPDNIELDANGDLWVASPFANAVYKVDPDTGDRQTMFSPTPEASARIVSEAYRRLDAGEAVLPLLGPDMWGPMPGLLTGIILSPDGTVYVSGLGTALVRLEGGRTDHLDTDSSDAKSAIRGAIASWVKIYNRNDWNELANQFTEDAIMMPPNSPAVVGRSAIAAWENDRENGFSIALMPEEISINGDRAIVRGRSCVFIPLDDNQIGVDIGKFLEVRRRQPDGRWLVSHDIFNSDLPVGSSLAKSCRDKRANPKFRGEKAADPSQRQPEKKVNAHRRPAGADALTAALEHHEVLLENGRVRVLETCIPGGERTKFHAHGWPAVHYVVAWSDFVRRTVDGKIVTDSRGMSQHPQPGQALWSGPADLHSIENVGKDDLCVTALELKAGDSDFELMPVLENRTRIIIDGIRSGDVSEIMALYSDGSLYSPDNATLLSDRAAIQQFWMDVAPSPAHDTSLDVVRIERLGPDAFLEILKYDVQ